MEERKLIFTNIANGVPIAKIMEAFHKSEKEIMDIFHLVIRKINSYCASNDCPFVECGTIGDVRRNRFRLFPFVDVVNLDKPVIFKVTTQPFDQKYMQSMT